MGPVTETPVTETPPTPEEILIEKIASINMNITEIRKELNETMEADKETEHVEELGKVLNELLAKLKKLLQDLQDLQSN